MDRTAFTESALGRVRKTLEGYDAFYPAPVPRQVPYAGEVPKRLEEATAAVHRLAGVTRLLPSPELLMGPSVRIEAVLSSRIEGTQTTVGQLLLFEGVEDDDPHGDAREVLNYVRALHGAIERLRTLPLSLRVLREAHAELMAGVRGEHLTPGEFRRSQNWIGPPGATLRTARYVPPPVEAMHEALADLEQFLHERDLPDLIAVALAHYQFEVVHPFLDGNGRVGRMLIPLMLAEREILPRPMLYLSAYLERHRTQYYDLLFRTSATGELEPWLVFFLRGVAVQARDAEERAARLVDLLTSNRERLLAERVSANVVRLAEQLLDLPYITVRRAQQRLDVTFPTAAKAIDTLVELGVLTEITGRRRNRIYHSPKLFEAVYGDAGDGSAHPS